MFDRHYDHIWRYLSRRAGAATADDLASETFLRAFAARRAYDTAHADAAPWLYGIATNLLRERARSERRRLRAYARAVEPEALDAAADEALGRIVAGALRPALIAALETLSPEERDDQRRAHAAGRPIGRCPGRCASHSAGRDRPGGCARATAAGPASPLVETFTVPGAGRVEYWAGDARNDGICVGLRLPGEGWDDLGGGPLGSGPVPGCL